MRALGAALKEVLDGLGLAQGPIMLARATSLGLTSINLLEPRLPERGGGSRRAFDIS